MERIRTDCLWPSFTQVEVAIYPHGEGWRVSDEGGGARSAWIHGADDAVAQAAIRDAAIRYGAEIDGVAIYADAHTEEWKRSAILAVANASAAAAHEALAGTQYGR